MIVNDDRIEIPWWSREILDPQPTVGGEPITEFEVQCVRYGEEVAVDGWQAPAETTDGVLGYLTPGNLEPGVDYVVYVRPTGTSPEVPGIRAGRFTAV